MQVKAYVNQQSLEKSHQQNPNITLNLPPNDAATRWMSNKKNVDFETQALPHFFLFSKSLSCIW